MFSSKRAHRRTTQLINKTLTNHSVDRQFQRTGQPRLTSNALFGALALGLLLVVAGCGGGSGSSKNRHISSSKSSSSQGRVDHLNQALDYVYSDSMYRSEAYVDSVAGGLNGWSKFVTDVPEWELDPLVETLPIEYQQDLQKMDPEDLGFNQRDVEFLLEANWCRALSQWINSTDRYPEFRYLFPNALSEMSAEDKAAFGGSGDRLAYLIHQSQPNMTSDEAGKLAIALRAFDWVVRNIQLVELRETPSDLEIRMEALASAINRAPAAKGVAGPGYTLFPWQSMKFGRGDSWQRARVLVAICRQFEIDVVMLAVTPDGADGEDNVSDSTQPEPWLPGICIGEQVYLCDTQLGLPIPAVGRHGVATLAEAKSNPEVLTRLTVFDPEDGDELTYRMTSDRLSSVTAYLDFAPQWFMRKMLPLSSRLTGDRRMRVFALPSEQAERVKQCEGVEAVQLWEVPFATLAYRQAYDAAVARKDDRVAASHLLEEQSFDIDIDLMTGRHRAFLGMFESDEELSTPGAKDFFISRRFDDQFIKELESNPELQYYYGINRASLTADEINQYVSAVQSLLLIVRTHASYWLGLAHYETGNISSAKNWLSRVEKNDPNGIWQHGTQYNLGRCDESLGHYQEAIDAYVELESPQRAGDLLRAEWLKALVKKPK